MGKREDGGPAFPATFESVEPGVGAMPDVRTLEAWRGMSLRDWFAGQALSGIWAQMAGVTPEGLCPTEEIPLRLARAAYIQADAMLAERNKGEDK